MKQEEGDSSCSYPISSLQPNNPQASECEAASWKQFLQLGSLSENLELNGFPLLTNVLLPLNVPWTCIK